MAHLLTDVLRIHPSFRLLDAMKGLSTSHNYIDRIVLYSCLRNFGVVVTICGKRLYAGIP